MNALLAPRLTEYSVASIKVVLEPFENALHQFEHFHHPLRVSREKIQPGHMLKDGKIISLKD